MDDVVRAYVDFLEWMLLALVPAMAVLTIRTWQLARRYWPFRLPVIGALICTIVGAACTWLAITVLWRWNVGLSPAWFVPLTATAVVSLTFVPFLMAGYLVWADRHPEELRKRTEAESRQLAAVLSATVKALQDER